MAIEYEEIETVGIQANKDPQKTTKYAILGRWLTGSESRDVHHRIVGCQFCSNAFVLSYPKSVRASQSEILAQNVRVLA